MAEEPQNQEKNREKNGRFVKGASGNPGGRPKNHNTSIINLLGAKLEEIAPSKDKKSIRLYKEIIVEQWMAMIIKGSVPALKEALDRLYGKPKEHIELEGGSKPVELRVKYDDSN